MIYEDVESTCEYGFCLGADEFYEETSESIDLWVGWLKKESILLTFEEDFTIIKEIGRGSSSIVYLAESVATHKQYAAKCVEKSLLRKDKNFFNNLIQEIKVLFYLEHPSIIKLFHVYETSEYVYLILEYLPHEDLYKRILQKKILSEEDCSRFAKNLLDVLDYMHSKHIVHRDLKLENIIMTSDNDYSFKIVDFGLSYESEECQNEICGSPGYIAPEILRRCKYNQKVDIFSAGVLMYTIITGQHPFKARKPSRILSKNMKCLIKDHILLKDLAREFVMSMLQPKPEKRPYATNLKNHPWIVNLNFPSDDF